MPEEDINEKLKKDHKIITKYAKWTIVIMFLLPIIVFCGIIYWYQDFFMDKNFGDTIGGLISPIVGVLSSLLVYYALKSQINANNIALTEIFRQSNENQQQKEFDRLLAKLNFIKDQISNFKSSTNGETQGFDAIWKSFTEIQLKVRKCIINYNSQKSLDKNDTIKDDDLDRLYTVKLILEYLRDLLYQIDQNKYILRENDKIYLVSVFSIFYRLSFSVKMHDYIGVFNHLDKEFKKLGSIDIQNCEYNLCQCDSVLKCFADLTNLNTQIYSKIVYYIKNNK